MNRLEQILNEIKSGSVILTCGKHRYVAARKLRSGHTVVIPPNPDGPSKGCKLCWEVYYVSDHCLTPPGKRQERLEELDEVTHHLIEYIKKGKFDFVPDINPTIRYYKDAADDETGEDKQLIITDLEEEKVH